MTYRSRGRSFLELAFATTFSSFLVGFIVVLCVGNYVRAKRAMEKQRARRLARLDEEQRLYGCDSYGHSLGTDDHSYDSGSYCSGFGGRRPTLGSDCENLQGREGERSYLLAPQEIQKQQGNFNQTDVNVRQRQTGQPAPGRNPFRVMTNTLGAFKKDTRRNDLRNLDQNNDLTLCEENPMRMATQQNQFMGQTRTSAHMGGSTPPSSEVMSV